MEVLRRELRWDNAEQRLSLGIVEAIRQVAALQERGDLQLDHRRIESLLEEQGGQFADDAQVLRLGLAPVGNILRIAAVLQPGEAEYPSGERNGEGEEEPPVHRPDEARAEERAR